MMLPVIEPAPVTAVKVPIDHPNWLYELKHDGFRGMLYVDRERAWLRSRKGNEMRRFDALSQQIRALLKGQRAILDGEIVVLDSEGRSIFADLMLGRGEPSYCAFDLVWVNGRDLRQKPLLERKRLLRGLVPKDHPRLLYMSHLDSGGSRFFELVCEQNLEGIVCKPKTSPYPFTWIKVKNPNYTQAADRGEWFNRPRK
jgi:bifunctional non-homologous end joining protein LigD